MASLKTALGVVGSKAALAAVGLAALCASAGADEKFEPVRIPDNPYPSTYKPKPSAPTLIRNATIYDGSGRILTGDVLIEQGRIEAVGGALKAPKGAVEIDAKGRFVTPGIIDIHSHLGVYPSPGVNAHDDGNEATKPVTPDVWAEHSVWPQDPGFSRALAGGVTAMQILPGSANLFGGRSVTLKNVPARTVQGMKFPDAPYGLKMACGENPKRVYGQKSGPATRMGNMAGYRAAWIKAVDYRKQWDDYTKKAEAFAKDGGKEGKDGKKAEPPKAPDRKLDMDTLADVLRGKISIQMHCYRADEMALIIDMSKEFGYKVSTFHHAVESYKIADILAREQICSAMWADWWGFKLEAWDTVRENIPLVHKASACAIVHSDSAIGIQRLNQEAAKALADGRRAGIEIDKGTAWTWLSLNPAKAMGIDKETGSLEKGKAADMVIWSRDPFSVYARADQVFIDGAMLYDRFDPKKQPVSDFELGYDAPVRKTEGQP
ncbi:MAG: amidohydrolase [Caulobacterales bacterium]|jgi:imidazolonepropionase-like amidohydrolase